MYQRTRRTSPVCLLIGGLVCAWLVAGCSDQRANEALARRMINARHNIARWQLKEARHAEQLDANLERIETKERAREERFDDRIALERQRIRSREQRWHDEEPVRLSRLHRAWHGRPEDIHGTWIELLD